jgi:hypothetical protein
MLKQIFSWHHDKPQFNEESDQYSTPLLAAMYYMPALSHLTSFWN